jgi:hypothetical protein
MSVDLDEAKRKLAASTLADLALSEVALPEQSGSTLVIDIADRDLLPTWREARVAVGPLRLHPVGVSIRAAEDWTKADLFSRFFYGEGDNAPASVIERARNLTVVEALSRFAGDDQWVIDNWAEIVDQHVALSERLVGSAPETDVLSGVAVGDTVAGTSDHGVGGDCPSERPICNERIVQVV